MKMNFMFKALVLGAVCVAGVACSSKKSAEPEQQAQVVAKPKVTVATSATEKVDMQSIFTGNVEGHTINNITPQQARRISRLLVDVGDRVKAGQIVAEMDNSSLAQLKAQYENNKAQFERTDELYKFGGESKANWEAIKTAYEVSKFSYENMLENTTLRSPITGVITARNYDNGDMVGGMPIFVVQRINPVKIMINVSESLYTNLKRGMPVEVEFDALPDQKFTAKVSRITPSVDASTRTFPVELAMVNDHEIVKPGMYARATLNYGTRESVVVPDQAVVKLMGSGDRFVYVYENGKVKYQKVELGRRFDNKYEILSGVASGAQVVIAGQSALKDGIEVEIVK
ncbi:MAG: efflux RND transporter periplasmic adaptor subunit [Alistipes sp.]|jgi:RND family efflux transporter MFP subunit|nr:efflux RND transporter periplasmic adaptor subunit [Alistipes sp.]MBQ2415022.1 efflux RND transporter periplasmic adaptor subunit [Alistipes sp.]MBQ5623192.1 efflux RND transporter periplasmic adaptor subunit [Alistipes sp.]MBQ5785327.1 efflux RND transporter periplasmic adaptor subunit [Alistipes sp.]